MRALNTNSEDHMARNVVEPKGKQQRPNRLASTPTAAVLNKLLAVKAKSEENSSAARGTYGKAVQTAETEHNLHTKAWGAIATLHKLAGKDPVKAREYLFHFDAYRRELKLDDMAGQDLLPDRQKGGAAAKAGGKKMNGKEVTKAAKGGRAKAKSKAKGADVVDLTAARLAKGDTPETAH